ncbi:hypothetical protein ASC95_10110 [Pelomonas sp. Root1217]|uniref:hypothetical protein n=1 Tax=Pelomonas sp. Root1217 TaxID=1736430 RepID=UPI00070D554D|nr:hypothetical protein ASC95_10110 [Pelomonas sp. Root1217]
MRIALVSDIHGNVPAQEAVVADIARRGIVARGLRLPRHAAQRLRALAGDHRAMAALAQRNGRPDWAQALLNGYVS